MSDELIERLMNEYTDLKMRYAKLCAFLKRVEEGSSPIHDDYPVAELYEQKVVMEGYLETLKRRLEREGVEM